LQGCARPAFGYLNDERKITMKAYVKPMILSTFNSLSKIQGSPHKHSTIASDNNGMTFTATTPAYEGDE
jgi:hypothetical protein